MNIGRSDTRCNLQRLSYLLWFTLAAHAGIAQESPAPGQPNAVIDRYLGAGDNIGNDDDNLTAPPNCPPLQDNDTVDLGCDWPVIPRSEIVWETQVTGTYFIKVRTTTCDEDFDSFCETRPSRGPEGFGSPDGVGLDTAYSITLQ